MGAKSSILEYSQWRVWKQ